MKKSPKNTCQVETSFGGGEWSGVCALPFGHAGEHEYVDMMGVCMVNDHCRAFSATWANMMGSTERNNGWLHNH